MKKSQHRITLLLTMLALILGVILGGYYRDTLVSFLRDIISKSNHASGIPATTYHCPPPELAKAHQYDPSTFENEQLYWQMNFEGWEAPQTIGFMQAMINQDHGFSCYYRWPNPKEKGTYLWMTVQLSPSSNQVAQPYGSYWIEEDSHTTCRAGIRACAFTLPPDPEHPKL